MRLSALQKYIILECARKKGKVNRESFVKFYEHQKNPPKRKDQIDTVSKTIKKLIDKGQMVGYGVQTLHKWYVKEVRLTPKGRKTAKQIKTSAQQKLPIESKNLRT